METEDLLVNWGKYLDENIQALIRCLQLDNSLLTRLRDNKLIPNHVYKTLQTIPDAHLMTRSIHFIAFLSRNPQVFTAKEELISTIQVFENRSHPRPTVAAIFRLFLLTSYPEPRLPIGKTVSNENRVEGTLTPAQTQKAHLQISGKSEAIFLATCYAAFFEQYPDENLPLDPSDFFDKLSKSCVFMLVDNVSCDKVEDWLMQHPINAVLQSERRTAQVALKATPACSTGPAEQHILSSIGEAIKNACSLLSPTPVSVSLISRICLTLPPFQKWHTKNNMKVAALQPVTDELIQQEITQLVDEASLTKTNDYLQLNVPFSFLPTDVSSEQRSESFLQWFLYEYAAVLGQLPEGSLSLPFLLDNLLPLVAKDFVLEFFFHIHEKSHGTKADFAVTSVYLYLVCQKIHTGGIDLRNRTGFYSKLAPFFSHYSPGEPSIFNLYNMTAAYAETCNTDISGGLPRSIRHFNFRVDDLGYPVADQTSLISEIETLLFKTESEASRPHVVVIYGLPGSGKTTLVKKYLLDKVSKPIKCPFTNIIWLNAESDILLVSQLRQMCREVFYDENESEELELAEHLYPSSSSRDDDKYFDSNDIRGKIQTAIRNKINVVYNHLLSEPSVIILDGANSTRNESTFCEPTDFIPKNFSSTTAPVVFITTQNANNWLHLRSFGAQFLALSTLQPEASVKYIADRLGTSLENSIELANHLDYFPMALQVACELVQKSNSSNLGPSEQQNIHTLATFSSDLNAISTCLKPHLAESTLAGQFIHTLQQRWLNLDSHVQHADAKVGLDVLDVLTLMDTAVPTSWLHEAFQGRLKRPDARYFHQVLQYLQLCSLLIVESDKCLRVPELQRLCRIVQLTKNLEKSDNAFNMAISVLDLRAATDGQRVRTLALELVSCLLKVEIECSNHLQKLVRLSTLFSNTEDKVQYLKAFWTILIHHDPNYQMDQNLKKEFMNYGSQSPNSGEDKTTTHQEICQGVVKADVSSGQVKNSSEISTGIVMTNLDTFGDEGFDQSYNYVASTSSEDERQIGSIIFNFDVGALPEIVANRDAELEQMRRALSKPTESGAKLVILVGMGGAGKSTLAKLYFIVEKAREPFDHLIWIDAEEPENVMASFKQLLNDHLNVHRQIAGDQQLINAVYNLILKRKTLIVFDNVENVDHIRRFLPKLVSPKNPPPHVIVTTRVAGGWQDYKDHRVHVRELSLEVCKGYIRDSLATSPLKIPDVEEKWIELSEYFGGHVIALQTATMSIVEQNKLHHAVDRHPYAIEEFLREVKRTNLLEEEKKNMYDPAEATYRPLRQLWTATLNNLPQLPYGQIGERVLEVLAFLSPVGVPISWIKFVCADLVGSNGTVLMKAIDFLISHSLLTKSANKFQIHRVLSMTVQSRIRSKSGKLNCTFDWLLPAVEQLYSKVVFEMELEDFYTHLHSLLQNIVLKGNVPNSVVSFLVTMNQSGNHICGNSLDELAQNILKKEATISRKSLGLVLNQSRVSDRVLLLRDWIDSNGNMPIPDQLEQINKLLSSLQSNSGIYSSNVLYSMVQQVLEQWQPESSSSENDLSASENILLIVENLCRGVQLWILNDAHLTRSAFDEVQTVFAKLKRSLHDVLKIVFEQSTTKSESLKTQLKFLEVASMLLHTLERFETHSKETSNSMTTEGSLTKKYIVTFEVQVMQYVLELGNYLGAA